MAKYTPSSVNNWLGGSNSSSPPAREVYELFLFITAELNQIARALDQVDSITFVPLHTEPLRLYTGLTVLADGTDWDPGSGEGVYTYYGGAWHKLG